MDDKIDDAMKNVLAMIRSNSRQDEALKFSQAALNLAHAKQIYDKQTYDAPKKRASS